LPLGCDWPGSEHPLIARIALLKRKPPGKARRITGMGLVLFAATFAGLGAWAAQPPVAAKSMAASRPGMAQTTLPAMRAAQDQTTANTDSTGSDNDVDMSKNAPGSAEQALPSATEAPSAALPANQVAINRAAQQAFQTNEAATTSADPETWLPAPPPLPKEVSASETGAASNDPPAVALNDQPVSPIQPTARGLSVGPVQAALSTPPATQLKSDSNEPYRITRCMEIPNNTVTGRVTSSTMIQIPKFVCGGPGKTEVEAGGGGGGITFNSGPCKHGGTMWAAEANLPVPNCPNRLPIPMNVQLANAADAGKMPLGKLVTLNGDFLVITKNKVHYLLVQNARVLYADPFGR
jgi:hypothetical protein